VGVIARPTLGATCRRDYPWRKTTWPCPDLAERQRRRAAQRLGCHRTVPPAPCAERDPPSLHLAHRPGESGHPAARLSGNHRAVRAAEPIHHPGLVRIPLTIRGGTAPRGAAPLSRNRVADALKHWSAALEGLVPSGRLTASSLSRKADGSKCQP